MNVKRIHTGAAIIFFVFLFAGGVFFDVRAEEDGASSLGECPEWDQLKKRSAQIGGNAWNYYTLWIYNRFAGADPQGNSQNYGVNKKKEEGGVSDGSELDGWSYSQRFGHICWGETCTSEGDGNLGACDGTPHCTEPSHTRDVYDALDRQTFLNDRDDSFAEIDFENREKICHERDARGNPRYSPDPLTGRDEPVVKPCSEIPEDRRGAAPAYCLYPLKGWMKIRSLRDEGWVRLSGRIVGATVPQELRDENGRVVNPGTFGEWENWKRDGAHLNCSDDVVFRANIKACSYRVVYDPSKKEFYGWAWNPLLQWIAFSGSTLFDTRAWKNKNWCDGPSCTEVSYDVQNKRSRWNTAYLGVWVRGLGGSFFARKGFSGINPPLGEFNADYLLVTGRFTRDSDQNAVQADVGNWEGRCDDSLIGSTEPCGRIATLFKDKRKDEHINPNEIFDLARPTASQRDNRSAIKRGSLGVLDTEALFPAEPIVVGQSRKNAAGNMVTAIESENHIWQTQNIHSNTLNNGIYYYEGDLEIGTDDDRNKRIIPYGLPGNSGAGTVVVKGNLIIRRPIEYDPRIEHMNSPSQLPSLAWVVLEHHNDRATPPTDAFDPEEWKKGGNIVIDACIPPNDSLEARPQQAVSGENIYDRTFTWEEERDVHGDPVIDPMTGETRKKPNYANDTDAKFVDDVLTGNAIASVAGSFFAENTFVTGHGRGGGSGADCANLGLKFKTSVEKTVEDQEGNESVQLVDEEEAVYRARQVFVEVPLEIRGIVVARNILFDRVYRGVNRGSETIVNTGRMLVNPPPGIAEFVRSLPLW